MRAGFPPFDFAGVSVDDRDLLIKARLTKIRALVPPTGTTRDGHRLQIAFNAFVRGCVESPDCAFTGTDVDAFRLGIMAHLVRIIRE